MEFLIQLLDFIRDIWQSLLPFHTVNEYDRAVILRLGKFHKVCEPGPHFKVPLIDDIITCRVSFATINIRPQSLTTKDGQNVVVSAVIKYKVDDPKTFTIEVDDPKDAIADIAQGKIKELIIERSWEECKSLKDTEIKGKVAKEASKWGIKVDFITITDLALMRSIRLIQ